MYFFKTNIFKHLMQILTVSLFRNACDICVPVQEILLLHINKTVTRHNEDTCTRSCLFE